MTLRESTLSGDEISAWREYGYIRLGKVAPVEMIQALCERIDEIMLGKVTYPNMLMQLCPSTVDDPDKTRQTKTFKGSTLKYRKIQDLEQDPLFLSYIQHPLFRDITRKLIGNEVSAYRSMFMNKPAGGGSVLPWHQDRWSNLDRDPQLTIWTALDPATKENGCVKIIPCSHHHLINPDDPSAFLSEEQLAELDESAAISLELEEGEVVLLNNWLLHSSDLNRSDNPRRAFSICYMDADTKSTTGAELDYSVIFGDGALTVEGVGLPSTS